MLLQGIDGPDVSKQSQRCRYCPVRVLTACPRLRGSNAFLLPPNPPPLRFQRHPAPSRHPHLTRPRILAVAVHELDLP